MRALIFHEPGRIQVEQVPDPAPGPGEAVLRVGAGGICASDLRVFRGEKHAAAGVIPGHEFAGTVAAVGPGVDTLHPGDRVAVYPILACGGCDFCRRGLRNRCLARQTLGYDRNGGLAEYVLLPEAIVRQGQAVALPEGLSLARASLTEPVACVLNSLETCGLRAGSSVFVVGAGPMGLLHVILARALGAGAIIVSEPVPARRAMADRLGATVVVDSDPARARAAVLDATRGQGAEVVIISVGLGHLTEAALPLAARQAWVNLFAGFPPGATATIDANFLHYNEIRLTGTQNATPDQFRRTAALLPTLPSVERVVTHRFTADTAADAYAIRNDSTALKSMVLFDPGAAL